MILRHVSNAGILLEAGSRSFGIDVFAKDKNKLYMDTPEAERRLIMNEAESGKLCLLIITHEHGDHFHAPDVCEAMERSPRLRIVSNTAAAEVLCEAGADMDRVLVYPSGMTESMYVSPPGMPKARLEIFAVRHDGEEYLDVENLVCMVDCEGKTAVFTADAKPSAELFARIGRKHPAPDMMAVPFPLVGLPSARKAMAASLAPRKILAYHLPRPECDEHGWRDSAYRVCERYERRDGLPMPVFGDVPGMVYGF